MSIYLTILYSDSPFHFIYFASLLFFFYGASTVDHFTFAPDHCTSISEPPHFTNCLALLPSGSTSINHTPSVDTKAGHESGSSTGTREYTRGNTRG